jgi:mannosyltransferase OCH1-like enzyme
MTFPKIIWQTHNYKKESLPTHLFHIGNTWKNLNPGWEYKYVDHLEREETVKKYPEIYEFYKQVKPITQSDIWRFLITYEYGGCYADMDSVCVMPLDYLIETIGGNPEIITVPEKEGIGNTHNFIVKPKSPIMDYVINHMIFPQSPDISKPFTPFQSFVDAAYSYPNVSKSFVAAHHGEGFKDINYRPFRLEIDYYGTKMEYRDYLKQNSLEM